MDEILDVAIASLDGRRDGAIQRPTMLVQPVFETREHALPHPRIADDAAAWDFGRSGLELWFEQHRANRTRKGANLHRRQDSSQRNERHIRDKEVDRSEFGEVSRVYAFAEFDAGVGADSGVELGTADIDGEHGRGSALEKAIGKAAR